MPEHDTHQDSLSLDQRRTLIGLRRRLEEYRLGRRQWSELSPALQQEAVAAIDGGIAAMYLRGVCEIPSSYLARWVSAGRGRSQDGSALQGRGGSEAAAEPRVLRVVQDAERAPESEDVELNVRVGQWQLSLRLAGPCWEG